LIAANGNADNQVQVMVASTGSLGTDIGGPPGVTSPLQAVTRVMLAKMDQWLANIAADRSDRSAREKVVRNKPADLVDSCYTASLERITDMTRCAQLFPYYARPRIVAGEPWTAEHVKCALKPIDARDYVSGLASTQLAQLQAIFPNGVCDYRQPPIEQQPLQGTWLTYPGNGDVQELPRE